MAEGEGEYFLLPIRFYETCKALAPDNNIYIKFNIFCHSEMNDKDNFSLP